MLFLLTVLGPDNPRVMAHCFSDFTTGRSPGVIDQYGFLCGFTSRPVFLHSHSYIQFYLALYELRGI